MRIEQISVGAMQVCCYIVSCETTKEAAIIDPGGDENTILDRCQKNDLNVKYIIATHGHPDHVCGNGLLKDKTGAQIVMHKDDAEFFWKPEVRNYFSMPYAYLDTYLPYLFILHKLRQRIDLLPLQQSMSWHHYNPRSHVFLDRDTHFQRAPI